MKRYEGLAMVQTLCFFAYKNTSCQTHEEMSEHKNEHRITSIRPYESKTPYSIQRQTL